MKNGIFGQIEALPRLSSSDLRETQKNHIDIFEPFLRSCKYVWFWNDRSVTIQYVILHMDWRDQQTKFTTISDHPGYADDPRSPQSGIHVILLWKKNWHECSFANSIKPVLSYLPPKPSHETQQQWMQLHSRTRHTLSPAMTSAHNSLWGIC